MKEIAMESQGNDDNWRSGVGWDERSGQCNTVLSRLGCFFHTITGDVLRNKATAFEAKEFRTAANKPEYFDGIARGLTNLNNTQIPGGMQPADAERPPDGMNPTLLSTLMAAASAGVTQRNLNTSQNLQFLMQAGGVPVSQGPMAALQLHQASGGVGLTAYQSFLQQNHVRNVQMSLQEMQAILTAGVYPTEPLQTLGGVKRLRSSLAVAGRSRKKRVRFCPSLGAPENDKSKLTAPNIPSRRRQAKQNASIGAAQPAIQGMNVNEGIPGVGNLGMTGTLQSMFSAGEGNPTGFWNGEQVGFDADGVILNTGAAVGQVNGSVPGVSNPGMAGAFQPILSDGQGNPASSFNEQDVGIDLGLGSHAAGTARANGGVPGVINPGMAGAPQPILGGDQEHLASSVNGQMNSNAAGEGQANGGVPGVDNPGMAGALQPILSSLHGNPASSITDQKVDDGMGPKDTNVIGIVPVPVNPGMTGKLEAENKFWARLEKLKKKYPLPDTVPIVRIMIDRQPADEKKEHENSMRHCFALLRLDRSVKFQPNFTPDLLESLDFFMHRVTTDYKNLEKSGMLHVPIVSSPQDNQEPRESQPVMRGRSGSSAMHAAVNAAKMKPIVDQENDLSLEGSKTQLPKQVAAVPVSTSNVDKHGLVNAPELPVNHDAAPSNGKDLSRNEQELTESETAEPQAARDTPGGTLKPSKAERSGKDENVFMADETLGTPKKASGEVIVCAHEQMMDAREANQESTAAEDVPDASGKGTTAGRNAEPVLSSAPAESPEATAAGLIDESDAEPGTTAGPIAPAPEAIDSGVPNAKKRTRVEASQDRLVDHALNTARLAAKRADLLERHKEARIQDTLDAMRNESSFLDDLDWTDDETGSRADTAMDEDDDSRMKDVRRTELELFNGALDVFERENGAELAKALENEADTADGDARDTAAGDETGADVGDASTETGLPPAKRLKK